MRSLLVVCLAACSAHPSRAVTATTASEAPAEVIEFALDDASLDGDRACTVVGRGDGAERLVLRGGRRVVLDDHDARVADDRFVTRIDHAVRAAGRWTFVAEDGAVADADTFLGALRYRGELQPGDVVPASRGRLVAVRNQVAFAFDAEGLRRIDALAPGAVLDLAFDDALHGAAWLTSGDAFRTDDGGATWTPADRFDPARDARGDSVTTAECERAQQAIERQTPALLGMAPARSVRFAQGFARLGPLPGQVTLFDATTGAVRRVVPDALPDERCALRAWGPALAAVCHAESGDTWLRSEDGERFARVPREPPRSALLVLSDDGAHAAWRAPCDGASDEPSDQSVYCALLDPRTGATRELVAPANRWPSGFMHGPVVLIAPPSGCAPAESLVAGLDVARGEVVFPTMAAPITDALGWCGAPQASVDGTVALELTRASNPDEVLALVGPLRGPLRVVTLPPGAKGVSFADARRGMATGVTLETLARTLDGGRTWEPVPSGVEGPPRPVRHTVDCRPEGCAIEGQLAVTGWGPLRVAPGRVLARRVAPDEPRERGIGLQMGDPEGCVTDGDAVRLPTPAPPARARARRFEGPQGGGTLVAGRDAADHLTLTARWAGVDGAGAFAGATTAAVFPSIRAVAHDDEQADYRLAYEGRDGVWVQRCESANRGCALFVGVDRRPVRAVEPFPTAREESLVPMVFPDGAGRFWVALVGASDITVARVSADGRASPTRTFPIALRGQLAGFARRNDRLFFAVTLDAPAPAVMLFDLDPPSRMMPVALPLPPAAPTACAGSSDALSLTLSDASQEQRVRLELRDTGLCVRGWERTHQESMDEDWLGSASTRVDVTPSSVRSVEVEDGAAQPRRCSAL